MQRHLREHLVGEAVGHHEARVARAAAQVHQPALGEQDDLLAVGEDDMVDLRLDLVPLVLLEGGHVDLVVEVPDVAHDGLVLHGLHVLVGDDLVVAGGGDEDVRLVRGVVHGHHAEALHRGLQRADGVDLGDPDLGAEALEALRGALADVTVAGDHGGLAGDHHVGGALDAVGQRLAATIEVVELGLGHRVVHVDRREGQALVTGDLIETVDAGGGLLTDPADLLLDAGVEARALLEPLLDRGEEGALLLVARVVEDGGVLLGLGADHDHAGRVATVVQDQVRTVLVRPVQDSVGELPVLFHALALVGEHRDALVGDGRGGMVLGGVDVAGGPADLGTQLDQCLDEHGGLDGHVQGAGDLRALEGLFLAVLLLQRHETGHLGLGDSDLLATPVGKGEIGNVVVGAGVVHDCVHGSLRWSPSAVVECRVRPPSLAPTMLRGLQRSSATDVPLKGMGVVVLTCRRPDEARRPCRSSPRGGRCPRGRSARRRRCRRRSDAPGRAS